MRLTAKIQHVLRRAMARAGIVIGHSHVCRRRGCGHAETAADAAVRRCPEDGRNLWPKPLVRPLRFHDLRHTTGSLLIQAGASPAAVQAILGHADVRTTIDRYAHLAPDYLRAEAERLCFGVPAPEPKATPAAEPVPAIAVGDEGSRVAPVLRDPATLHDGSPEGAPENEKARGYRAFRES